VTLLFSDMEGSTVLLKRLGDRYVEALDAQRRIQREAWSTHDGVELGTEGDSFYVVFATAALAVAAVAHAQRDLDRFDWPGHSAVRVRMGLHTGAPLPHDGAYVGIDVHRAARIAASAHGGQVVVSAETAALVSMSLPDDVRLRDLGDHRFKDLENPERVYQLEIDGLQQDFPPLRSVGASSTLPVLDAELVGRESEIERLTGSITDGSARLLTLTGPGGTGKTTLAVSVAHSLVEAFPGGVYFVDLASVVDEQEMWGAIAESLGLAEAREADDVAGFLASRRTVVILDNLEQIPQASKVVHRLLTDAGHLVVLATSRRPLHLALEHEFPVDPLVVPNTDSFDEIVQSPVVQMFARHARRVRPGFEPSAENVGDIVEICRRVDGMPLAIELAAARSKLLSPRAIVARLGTSLDLATHGADRPDRHHTIRETIAWSYDLLNEHQRPFFARLGVFVGGAELDAIADVCLGDDDAFLDPLDAVADIVDVSLAQVVDDRDGEPRLTTLESIRSYAAEMLEASGGGEAVRSRHAEHFAGVVARAYQGLIDGTDVRESRSRLNVEHANVTAALEWALDAAGDDDRLGLGLQMTSELGRFWSSVGRLPDSLYWLRAAVDRAGDRADPLLATCLAVLSNALRFHGEHDAALEPARRCLEILQALEPPQPDLPYALRTLAAWALDRDHPGQSRDLLKEGVSVCRATGNRYQLHRSLAELGTTLGIMGDLAGARAVEEEALLIARDLGDPLSVLYCQQNLSCTIRLLGDPQAAEAMMRTVLPAALALLGEFELVSMCEDYAAMLAELGRDRTAAKLLGAADTAAEEAEMPRAVIQVSEIGPAIDRLRSRMPTDEWAAAYNEGRRLRVPDALAAAVAESAGTPG
jgi:predicted ATPase/class 3 adenylate cyclase